LATAAAATKTANANADADANYDNAGDVDAPAEETWRRVRKQLPLFFAAMRARPIDVRRRMAADISADAPRLSFLPSARA